MHTSTGGIFLIPEKGKLIDGKAEEVEIINDKKE
jgi:hypothetical protein